MADEWTLGNIEHSLGLVLCSPCLLDLGSGRLVAKDEGRGALVCTCCLGHIVVGKEDCDISCQCDCEICEEEDGRESLGGSCVVGKE